MPSLSHTDTLYREIVEQTPEAVVFADREGLIRVWNDGARQIYGYSAEEALGQSLDLIVPERFRDAHWRGYRQAMASGETRLHGRGVPTQARRMDGQLIYVEISFSLIRDGAGELLGASSVARDITERYLKEKALKAKLAALENQAG